MTEPRNPLSQALDVVVYAPLGLAITVLEDFGELAEKGRARVQQRTTAARFIGQFAVAEGRRRLGLDGSVATRPGPSTAAATNGAPASDDGPADAADPAAAVASPNGAGSPPGGGTAARSDHLAIPGYDSLSASQVVQRLPSLSSAELAAVADYETATRGRRTILSRIAQLQQG